MINFPFNIGVSQAAAVAVYGTAVYYSRGSAGGADSSIKVKTENGDEYVLLPGQGFRLSQRQFGTLNITNAGGQAAIIGSLTVSDGDFFDNRVTGSVEVIDGGKARSLAGTAFIGRCYSAAVAGNYSHAQLWNPPASGKNILLSQVSCISFAGTATGLYLASHNAALPNFFLNPSAKKFGGAASVMEGRAGYAAIALGNQFAVMDTLIKSFKVTEPIVIPPGFGMMVINNTINSDIQATFEYFEESV